MEDVTVSSATAATQMRLTSMVERYQGALFGFLRGVLGDEEQALDLTQDVFCDAWRAMLRNMTPFASDAPEVVIRQWLFQTAYHRAMSALRRRRIVRWEPLDDPEAASIIPKIAVPSFESAIAEGVVLRAALGQLAPSDVACLLLRVVHGLTAAQTAAILGGTVEATNKRLSRAKQRLLLVYIRENDGKEGAR
jgi:RNA polymerase sigma factor CnrH